MPSGDANCLYYIFMTQNNSKILQDVSSKRNFQVEYILNLPPEDSFGRKQTVVV